jgi:hypothetical protein
MDRGRIGAAAALTVMSMSLVTSAIATPTLVAGGGLESYDGPGQRTRSAMAIVGAEAGGRNASLALLRWSDSEVGEGMGYALGIGIPLAPSAALRAWGTRFVGDEPGNPSEGRVRSWRVKVGPLVEFAGQSTAGVYYSHTEDDAGLRSNGAAAELTTPLGARFTGRAGASHANASDGLHATQATVGLEFAPARGVELSAETGVARNAAFLISPGSSSRMEPVLLLGVRVLLP